MIVGRTGLWLALWLAHIAGAGQETLRSGALSFNYWPGQGRAAAALLEAFERSPPLPGLPPEILTARPVTVYLAPDPATFDSLAPGVPDWSAGIAFPAGDEIVLPVFGPRAGPSPLATILRHELAHIALDRFLGSAAPRWFHEGYAQLASASWGARDAWTLRLAVLFGQLPSLKTLSLDFRGTRVRSQYAYLLSYTAVEYLYRLGGADGFAKLLERWRQGADLDLALRRTYGLTLSQYERMWRRDVSRRFGWLLVLTQTAVYWTALTILLLFMGYWKRRRTQRKLAALEARVREQDSDGGGLGAGAEDGPPWPD